MGIWQGAIDARAEPLLSPSRSTKTHVSNLPETGHGEGLWQCPERQTLGQRAPEPSLDVVTSVRGKAFPTAVPRGVLLTWSPLRDRAKQSTKGTLP